jgi:thermostable 8-oxoguanine DNA glycosylase
MTDRELQLRLLFALVVAGKSARFAEQVMNKLFFGFGDALPFDLVRSWASDGSLEYRLRTARTGNYTKISRALPLLANAGLDLRTCQPADLERIPGIGPKTSRFFIIWTRPNARVAALDVHILRWLRGRGYDAPKQTPQGKRYAKLETIFLAEADAMGMTPRALDQAIWSAGSSQDQSQLFDTLCNGE